MLASQHLWGFSSGGVYAGLGDVLVATSATGDSGGVALVPGIPTGVTRRTFGGYLGFTPLAERLAHLGLDPCTTPGCELRRP